MPVQKNASEAGQAVLVFVLLVSMFLIGALGWGLDGAQMWAQRQMAQAAADSAAQAGIMSFFDGTNSGSTYGTAPPYSNPATYTCTSADAGTTTPKTPCRYAALNGFTPASGDTVGLAFGDSTTAGAPAVSLSPSSADAVSWMTVTVTRSVSTVFMRIFGINSTTVTASGTAAIVNVLSPVPIIVTHPTMNGSFSVSGTGNIPKIKICGGPRMSVQVNSSSGSSLSATGNPVVDLSHAGPNDPGDCSAGTGADFGNHGNQGSTPFVLSSGTTGTYDPQDSPILDPLSGVSAPAVPAAAPAKVALANGASGCPASPPKACMLYSPGLYTSNITVSNEVAVFKPGIYYMNGASFQTSGGNGYMTMATEFTDTGAGTTGTGWTGNMLVYMTGAGSPAATGTINIGANGSVSLTGSPSGSSYKGILFFVDHNAAAQTYTLDGGGGLSLIGTVYATNSLSTMLTTPSQYQTVHFQGNAGSSTYIAGEIIVSALTLSGTPGITMNLNSAASYIVRQVALVQ